MKKFGKIFLVAAVKKFQGEVGVSQTGSTGPLTRAKIKEISCK